MIGHKDISGGQYDKHSALNELFLLINRVGFLSVKEKEVLKDYKFSPQWQKDLFYNNLKKEQQLIMQNPKIPDIPDKEYEVLVLLCQNKTELEIAEKLKKSYSTVGNQLFSLIKRFRGVIDYSPSSSKKSQMIEYAKKYISFEVDAPESKIVESVTKPERLSTERTTYECDGCKRVEDEG